MHRLRGRGVACAGASRSPLHASSADAACAWSSTCRPASPRPPPGAASAATRKAWRSRMARRAGERRAAPVLQRIVCVARADDRSVRDRGRPRQPVGVSLSAHRRSRFAAPRRRRRDRGSVGQASLDGAAARRDARRARIRGLSRSGGDARPMAADSRSAALGDALRPHSACAFPSAISPTPRTRRGTCARSKRCATAIACWRSPTRRVMTRSSCSESTRRESPRSGAASTRPSAFAARTPAKRGGAARAPWHSRRLVLYTGGDDARKNLDGADRRLRCVARRPCARDAQLAIVCAMSAVDTWCTARRRAGSARADDA